MQKQRLSPLYRPVAYSFLMGFAIFVFGASVEALLHLRRIGGLWELLDNLIIATLAGLIVFAYEQRRHKEMRQRLRMIGAMNHHVRNALQNIMFVPYTPGQTEQINSIHDSVNRIEWALREILPGEFPEGNDLPGLRDQDAA